MKKNKKRSLPEDCMDTEQAKKSTYKKIEIPQPTTPPNSPLTTHKPSTMLQEPIIQQAITKHSSAITHNAY